MAYQGIFLFAVLVGVGVAIYGLFTDSNQQHQHQNNSQNRQPLVLPEPKKQTEKSTIRRRRKSGTNSKECTICLENVSEDQSNMNCGSCGNIYHFKCIEKWLKEARSCPICRVEL